MGPYLKKYTNSVFLATSFFFPFFAKAQKTDTLSTCTITGYLDCYYAHYSDTAGTNGFQKFAVADARNNSPALNIASVTFNYTTGQIRTQFALNYGDIAEAAFPHPYENVLEARIGYRIAKTLWIDAGFFRPHFGTEFVLPVENITTPVAVATYYEPTCESGVKLNFDPTAKLEINLFLLNGYGAYVSTNNEKAFGGGVTYALGDHGDLGYTNYIGPPNNAPAANLRIDQNVFINYSVGKVKLQAGSDYCMQQNADIATKSKTAAMYTALATIKFQATKKFGFCARGELFQDPDGILSGVIVDNTGSETGYKLWGITGGLEFKPTEESYIRLEDRFLQMAENQSIFYDGANYLNYRNEVLLNVGITFNIFRNVRTTKTD